MASCPKSIGDHFHWSLGASLPLALLRLLYGGKCSRRFSNCLQPLFTARRRVVMPIAGQYDDGSSSFDKRYKH